MLEADGQLSDPYRLSRQCHGQSHRLTDVVHEVVADADTWERFVRNIDAEEPAQRFPKQMVGQSKVARQPSKIRDQSNSPPSRSDGGVEGDGPPRGKTIPGRARRRCFSRVNACSRSTVTVRGAPDLGGERCTVSRNVGTEVLEPLAHPRLRRADVQGRDHRPRGVPDRG